MAKLTYDKKGRLLFTKEMKKEYTVLIPSMAPIHFGMLEGVLRNYGYNAVLLDNSNDALIVENGLKYVHNDTCYPALLVIGQMITALQSGKFDPEKTALLITQTGGGCRASNYIHLLRKALVRAGFTNVPVVSLNLNGMERNAGFKITIPLLRRVLAAIAYGDMLMLISNQTRPFEIEHGETDALVESWTSKLCAEFVRKTGYKRTDIARNLANIAADFAKIRVNMSRKVRVGIVGEIYVKYSKLGNNDLEQLLADEGCEVIVPGILNFIMYALGNQIDDFLLYGGSNFKANVVRAAFNYFACIENLIISSLKKYPQFRAPALFASMKKLAQGLIGFGCKMGEGWLLTAEMAELIESGCQNIICTQPFGCLPNHICGKGMIRKLRMRYPNSNIVPIDYDPSATRVNQENRIKLMLSIAREGNTSPKSIVAQPHNL